MAARPGVPLGAALRVSRRGPSLDQLRPPLPETHSHAPVFQTTFETLILLKPRRSADSLKSDLLYGDVETIDPKFHRLLSTTPLKSASFTISFSLISDGRGVPPPV